MIKSLSFISALFFAAFMIIAGCKKESDEESDTQAPLDNAQAENILNELNEICDQAVEDGQLSTHRFGYGAGSLLSCPAISVTIDSADGSGSATIDFGTRFCMGSDSKYRKGWISVSFNGGYRDSGTVINVTTTNYFVGNDTANAIKVSGERIVTNNGRDSSGHLNYSIEVHADLTNNLSEQMNWHSIRNRKWIAGDTTFTRSDDEYLITGNTSAKSFGGAIYSAAITQALHAKLNCRWITAGKFSLTPEGKPIRTLDFGNGACDHNATVEIGSKTYQITLR